MTPPSPSPYPSPSTSLAVKFAMETDATRHHNFTNSKPINTKQFLTGPSSVGVLNEGYDNENSDLILFVNCMLVNNESKTKYIVEDLLGKGTFGQVAKCRVWGTENTYFAVKVTKSKPAFFEQAIVEVNILTRLNNELDPKDKHHIVRIVEYFVFHGHLCICFELLDMNLVKMNNLRGLPMSTVQHFSRQILSCLVLLKEACIIHCDLKPENILLSTTVKPTAVKVIDFGSSCMENQTVDTYIQTRYYRSPKVVLGYQYTTAIDMWSLGCIIVELFLGVPLFPGSSEFDLLQRMLKILGGQPPDHVLKDSKKTNKFFKYQGSVHRFENNGPFTGWSFYQALTEEEYEARELEKPLMGNESFNHMNLEEIIATYPLPKNLFVEELVREYQNRAAMIDFLAKRWTPLQASRHPFVTGEPFTCPFKPPTQTPHTSVARDAKMGYHPDRGYWFGAGMSHEVPSMNRGQLQNNKHYQMVPFSQAASSGNFQSHGIYTDGGRLMPTRDPIHVPTGDPRKYGPIGPTRSTGV